jgi:hypothetical protein
MIILLVTKSDAFVLASSATGWMQKAEVKSFTSTLIERVVSSNSGTQEGGNQVMITRQGEGSDTE